MSEYRKIHESFIERASRPMQFDGLPIKAKTPEVPVVAMERWRDCDGALYKTYRFRRIEDRNQFVTSLLAYELMVQHNAVIEVTEESVMLKLQTKDLGKATELDKEYARYADVLFKDLAFRPGVEYPNGDEG